MHIKLEYHDASIYKIEHHIKENRLTLGVMLSDSSLIELVFEDVIGWDLSPFMYQNFLLDFRSYKSDNLPQSIIDNYEVNSRYIEVMKLKNASFFEIDPASGLGGYIIAQSLKEVVIN